MFNTWFEAKDSRGRPNNIKKGLPSQLIFLSLLLVDVVDIVAIFLTKKNTIIILGCDQDANAWSPKTAQESKDASAFLKKHLFEG